MNCLAAAPPAITCVVHKRCGALPHQAVVEVVRHIRRAPSPNETQDTKRTPFGSLSQETHDFCSRIRVKDNRSIFAAHT